MKSTKTPSILLMMLLSSMLFHSTVYAKGNMIARCKPLDDQVLGIDDSGFEVKNKQYRVETGQCYKLLIQSTGKHEYILEGADFFSSIYIRKLDIGKVELKVNSIHSIDFDDEVAVKLYFMPVKPGEYHVNDKYMSQKGTHFSFIVE